MGATSGLGVDVAFDAAGVQRTLDAAIKSVQPRGTVVNVAIWEETAAVNMNLVLSREIFITGARIICKARFALYLLNRLTG